MPALPHHRRLLGGHAVIRETPAYLHGFSFSGKVGEVSATRLEEVAPAFRLVEERVASGLHAAGFVSYDAASAINGDLTTLAGGEFPLVWFGLFERRASEPFVCDGGSFDIRSWDASWSAQEFGDAVASIRELIAEGHCYQVNLTMRQRFLFSGSPRAYFGELLRCQPTPYSSYLESGRYRILSASPELFFSLSGGILTTQPMKGTAARGRWPEEDEAQKRRLKESPKELAENLMIVDLLRNDMGMISETGSVRVASLFDLETHPTVHQMTSTIHSRLKEAVGPLELMQALFPCGSVTGAPKRRSMEIIADLEEGARGLYTGCIGYFSPGGEAKFSVAIRTAVIDVECGHGEIGIGSGITYDSVAAEEYKESMSKARFAREQTPDFHLIESLLYDEGYFLLERHIERLTRSARYFSFPLDLVRARQELSNLAQSLAGKQKVRLLLSRDGSMSCEAAPVAEPPKDGMIGFAEASVDSADPFLYHKTSRRSFFAQQLAQCPGLSDVVFLNERGEVTEGSSNNIVAVVDGVAVTPPVACGLLAGVFRSELLSQGRVQERVLTRRDLEEAQEIYLINSVRKCRKVRLVK